MNQPAVCFLRSNPADFASRDAVPLRNVFRFPLAAPIPPLAFLSRKAWVARLCDSSMECVQDTRVLVLAGNSFKSRIHFLGIPLGQLGYGADAETVEVAEHRWSDGNEVAELTVGSHERYPFHSLSIRHWPEHTLPQSCHHPQGLFRAVLPPRRAVLTQVNNCLHLQNPVG